MEKLVKSNKIDKLFSKLEEIEKLEISRIEKNFKKV